MTYAGKGEHRALKSFFRWSPNLTPIVNWRELISSRDTIRRGEMLEQVVNAGLVKPEAQYVYDAVYSSGTGRISPRNQGQVFYFTNENCANSYINDYSFCARQSPNLFKVSYVPGAESKFTLPAEMQDKVWMEVLARLRDEDQSPGLIESLRARGIVADEPTEESPWFYECRLSLTWPPNKFRVVRKNITIPKGISFTSEQATIGLRNALKQRTGYEIILPIKAS